MTQRTRGWGPWREAWVSICSWHYEDRADCDLCQTGCWINLWQHGARHLVYRASPALWRRLEALYPTPRNLN